MIIFDAMLETIKVVGQFKPSAKDIVNDDIKSGFIWYDISKAEHTMDIDLDTLKDYISKVYDEMEKRLKVQEDLSKTFGVFKSIEIKED